MLTKKEKHNIASSKSYHKNPDVRKVWSATYYRKHKAAIVRRNKAWAKAHPEIKQAATLRHRAKCFDAWMIILKDRGMLTCSECGYNKCFAALEYHHLDPATKTRKDRRSFYFKAAPTQERVAELDGVIALCANCHRELHYNLKELH